MGLPVAVVKIKVVISVFAQWWGCGLGTGASKINDEVRLPCLAEVLGECLLKVIRVWRYIGEELPNKNVFSV